MSHHTACASIALRRVVRMNELREDPVSIVESSRRPFELREGRGDLASLGANVPRRAEEGGPPTDRQGVRREGPALELWRALVSGKWALVDQFENGDLRYVVAQRNEQTAGASRGLARREREVVWQASLGRSNKLIGHELGLSSSSVGTHLSRAAAKLGVRSRAELITTVRGILSGDHDRTQADRGCVVVSFRRPNATHDRLTPVERALLPELLRGATRRDIAVQRSRSVATVRHQVESIYRKLGVHSRAELAAACSRALSPRR
jgi:DNA-binding NarL/FixJ family response regulator